MPIYEYTCQACGHETEIFHGISETPPKKCPECGKPRLAKQMSASGFRLAGGGWYETDFKSDKKKNLVEKEAAPAAACAPAGCDAPGCGAKAATAAKAETPKASPPKKAAKAAKTKTPA